MFPSGVTCVCLYLNVIVVGDVFVSRSDACLDCLDPSLPQLLRLSLQHAAPAGLQKLVISFPCVNVNVFALVC